MYVYYTYMQVTWPYLSGASAPNVLLQIFQPHDNLYL